MTRIDVRNPRTGQHDYSFEPASRQDVQGTDERLRRAQPAWDTSGASARIEALAALKNNIESHREALLDALVHDTGRYAESVLEIDAVLGMIDRWGRLGPELLDQGDARTSAIPFVSVSQAMRPYPVVAVISPWNFPLLLSMIDTIPALLAGCAVMVKPSEIAPRFIATLRDAIPEGVPLAYVEGAAETGEAMVDAADAVCFTGSVATGRRVGEQAMRRFIPAFLELGGKDPAVVLASADLDRASSAILWGSTANAGQSCLSIERVYVERPAFDAFVDLLAEKARAVSLAVPEPADGQIGPIIAAKQIAVIEDHLADAFERGAKALTGGELEAIGGGTYLRPTVLVGVDHPMKVMTAETFGPIIPVMPVDDAEHAVRMANDTTYGLSAAVFAGTTEEAIAVGRRIDAGGISINDAALTALVYDGEKNSFNLSGLGGSRMGAAALRRFGRRQAFLVADGSVRDPWWYPHLRG